MEWWSNNWDKIATLILGGVVGFFTAVITTNNSIAKISDRITKIETNAISIYHPAAKKSDEHALKIIGLTNDQKDLKSSQELTDKLVELHLEKFQIELEKVRTATIQKLTEFVKESKNK